jgi:hypothetical protein
MRGRTTSNSGTAVAGSCIRPFVTPVGRRDVVAELPGNGDSGTGRGKGSTRSGAGAVVTAAVTAPVLCPAKRRLYPTSSHVMNVPRLFADAGPLRRAKRPASANPVRSVPARRTAPITNATFS